MCSWISKHKMRLGGFFRVTCGKTSKIISNLFSITFSTCVFWSQHAFSPLLSPFNRWLKHMEICLSVSQIKCNNEKKSPIFWDEDFQGTIFRRSPAVIIFFAPFYRSFTVIAGIRVRHVFHFSLSKYALFCACEDWSTAGPQAETRRQEYYCCLSRKKAD